MQMCVSNPMLKRSVTRYFFFFPLEQINEEIKRKVESYSRL